MTTPYSPESLDLLRDLLLEIAGGLDCSIHLLPSREGALSIAIGGLDEPSFYSVRDSLIAELADSLIPHAIDLVPLCGTPPAAALLWKGGSPRG